jgi:hypothetical protein
MWLLDKLSEYPFARVKFYPSLCYISDLLSEFSSAFKKKLQLLANCCEKEICLN